MNKELLLKYLDKSCTDQEFEEVVRWVKKEALNKKGKQWSFEDWQSFEPKQETGVDKKYNALLDKIHHEINLRDRIRDQNRDFAMSRYTSWLGKAAAILFIPLLGFSLYMLINNKYYSSEYADYAVDTLEVITAIGSRTIVQLSDGTEVNLNYGSKIRYPRLFNGDLREIDLEGEAYFNVAHNPELPFVVNAGQLQVKAVGTEFNVKAYADDSEISTTLVNGKVIVEKKMPGEIIQTIGAMVPGQHIVYHSASGRVQSSTGDIEKFIGWKEGKLIFDNEPIYQVAKELSRRFNVEIEVAEDVREYSYTLTFEDDRLFLILDLMTKITPIEYKVYPRERLSDGSFSKQRISLEKQQ